MDNFVVVLDKFRIADYSMFIIIIVTNNLP